MISDNRTATLALLFLAYVVSFFTWYARAICHVVDAWHGRGAELGGIRCAGWFSAPPNAPSVFCSRNYTVWLSLMVTDLGKDKGAVSVYGTAFQLAGALGKVLGTLLAPCVIGAGFMGHSSSGAGFLRHGRVLMPSSPHPAVVFRRCVR